MLVPIALQIVCILFHVVIGTLAFVVWIFLFHQVWAPPSPEDLQNQDTGDRTIAGKKSNIFTLIRQSFSLISTEHDSSLVYINDSERIYCANICSVCFKSPLDRYYE